MEMTRHSIYKFVLSLTVVMLLPAHGAAKEADQPPGEAVKAAVQEDTAAPASSSLRPNTPTPDGAASGKTGTAAKSGSLKTQPDKPAARPDPNRRWLMKQRDYRKQATKPKARPALKWKSASQKETCRAMNRQLAATFEKAQFYSIQGDRCKTAQYARAFLDNARQCRTQCPDKFMEYNGFGHLVVRNMHQLEKLGRESCLGPAQKAHTGKMAKP